jgi:hypothetical protein
MHRRIFLRTIKKIQEILVAWKLRKENFEDKVINNAKSCAIYRKP